MYIALPIYREGHCFNFLAEHENRHWVQANKVKYDFDQQMKKTAKKFLVLTLINSQMK